MDFFPNQFESEANSWIHEQTTGPEILEAFEGKKLDHFVMAYGAGGRMLGCSRVVRKVSILKSERAY
jgi:cysteine synthase A